jgi:hypothetical protein
MRSHQFTRTARLPLLYVELNQSADALQKGAGDKAAYVALLERFDGIAKKAGVTMINEGMAYDAWMTGARKIAEAAK